MVQSRKPEEPNPEEIMPTWDNSEAASPPPPEATPAGEAIPLAEPVPVDAETDLPRADEVPPTAEMPLSEIAAPPEPAPILCPVCNSPRQGNSLSCADCGYYFSPNDLAPRTSTGAKTEAALVRLSERYELGELIGERHGVLRYRGVDHGSGSPVPVVILKQALPKAPLAETVEEAKPTPSVEESGDEILPSFDDALMTPLPEAAPITEVLPARAGWPSIMWERTLLTTLSQPTLPRLLESFSDETNEYLVEEMPQGRLLWDAWDDPDTTSQQRFGWLVQIAEALASLHQLSVIYEGLRPDVIVVTAEGQARLNDLSDLLALPLAADAPVRGTLYTAPELLSHSGSVDARADLYSFGAMLYALHVGRELAEMDFDRPGHPKPFIPRFPDIHPAFGRLIHKTFRREVEARFPSDEAAREDKTGFLELIRTLQVLQRTFDNVRLEIASWTTTGMVRTGNEDAFALLHACESRQDDLGECALVLLADGMGGYEAGEVAAALAIQALRSNLVHQKPLAALAGCSPFPTDALTAFPSPEGHAGPALDVEAFKVTIKNALKDANKQVFTASRSPGSKRRGMGCTAEVVYVDGRHVIVGHVGDSRTYHLHEGRLIQMTRDQTLVNRLVELGTLSPEEAETHPRRNELQQAVGGQPDVEPGLYHGQLKPGDWVIVCSDGLTNHVTATELKQMLQSEALSAEMAARRLINFTNIQGATDNATVVVIRAT
jgi:serine/threonine protein phosphatase PrpC/serine/threonine protein kinase